ncbi:MAG: transposase family protein [Permianibacter sp.]
MQPCGCCLSVAELAHLNPRCIKWLTRCRRPELLAFRSNGRFATPSQDLLQGLSLIPDPRVDRSKRHDLAELLFVAVCATISGAYGRADLVEFAENRRDWLRQLARWKTGSRETIPSRASCPA